MTSKKQYRRTLTIAGSDSSGGAGIQADLKTFSALGCYGMSVVTALTAQNTQGVSGIHGVPTDFIERQLRAVVEDVGVDALKIGMLHSVEIIERVAACLKEFSLTNVVVDPVMVAKGGDALLEDNAVNALRDVMLPLAAVITPNFPEARMLLDREIEGESQIEQAALDLCLDAGQAVVLKGGRGTTRSSNDCLCVRDEAGEARVTWLNGSRVNTTNLHGAGCTFSSAIAAYLAHGKSKEEAIRLAKEYIAAAIKAGAEYEFGHGHGPVHHFFAFEEQS